MGFIVLFPLMFLSGIFVPIAGLPARSSRSPSGTR